MAEAAERQMTKEQAFRQQIASPAGRSQFEAALPPHVPVDRFIRMTMTVINQNPDLLKADRLSLQTSLMTCASLGLMPETFLGEAYFIPRGGKVTLQVGYKGLIKLARNTQEIASIESGVIFANDEFEYTEGDAGTFWVRPNLRADRGEPLAAWCVIRLKSGELQREIMSAREVEDIRKSSQSANSPAWKSHWTAMARKVVIKRALKYAPSSTELMKAIAIDDAPESGATVAMLTSGIGLEQIEVVTPKPEPAPRVEKKASAKGLAELEAHLTQHVEPEPEAPRGFHEQQAEDAQLVEDEPPEFETGLAG